MPRFMYHIARAIREGVLGTAQNGPERARSHKARGALAAGRARPERGRESSKARVSEAGGTECRRGETVRAQEVDLEQVEAVASLGFTDEEIAAVLGIAKSTLNNWKKNESFWTP